MAMAPRDIKRRLEKKKAEYSGFLGDIIAQNTYSQPIENMIPSAILRAFELISVWLGKENKKAI